MELKDLVKLAVAASKTGKSAASAYSFVGEDGKTEVFTAAQADAALRAELKPFQDYSYFRAHKHEAFALIEQSIDEVLPEKVEQNYMAFAEVVHIAQGNKAVFRQRVTNASRERAKTFVTRAALAGRYEVFMLDGREYTAETFAMGAACRIGFEEFLDGRISWAEVTEIIAEGMDEFIYREVAKQLAAAVEALPAANKATVAGFDEEEFDELLAIADKYGKATIYCTFEFASKMKPAEGWASNEDKSRLWHQGWLGDYKGHTVVILPQSVTDITNTTKAIDPSLCYILPTGQEKPVKIVFEGDTHVRTVDTNDDWSTDLQTYKKMGVVTIMNNWMCVYKNTNLKMETR